MSAAFYKIFSCVLWDATFSSHTLTLSLYQLTFMWTVQIPIRKRNVGEFPQKKAAKRKKKNIHKFSTKKGFSRKSLFAYKVAHTSLLRFSYGIRVGMVCCCYEENKSINCLWLDLIQSFSFESFPYGKLLRITCVICVDCAKLVYVSLNSSSTHT